MDLEPIVGTLDEAQEHTLDTPSHRLIHTLGQFLLTHSEIYLLETFFTLWKSGYGSHFALKAH